GSLFFAGLREALDGGVDVYDVANFEEGLEARTGAGKGPRWAVARSRPLNCQRVDAAEQADECFGAPCVRKLPCLDVEPGAKLCARRNRELAANSADLADNILQPREDCRVFGEGAPVFGSREGPRNEHAFSL